MHCYESRTHVYIHCFLLTARTFNLDASSIIFLILGVLSGFSVQFFSTSFSRRRCTEFIFVQVLRRQKRKRTKESNLTPITFLPHTQHAHRRDTWCRHLFFLFKQQTIAVCFGCYFPFANIRRFLFFIILRKWKNKQIKINAYQAHGEHLFNAHIVCCAWLRACSNTKYRNEYAWEYVQRTHSSNTKYTCVAGTKKKRIIRKYGKSVRETADSNSDND